MKIIIDTREQEPFTFRHEKMNATTELGTLAVGDYSLAGLEDKVAVERKSLSDLVMCLGRERERFERELARGAALDAFAVVCEGSWLELARGEYRSRLNPHAACQSVLACRGKNAYKKGVGSVLQHQPDGHGALYALPHVTRFQQLLLRLRPVAAGRGPLFYPKIRSSFASSR